MNISPVATCVLASLLLSGFARGQETPAAEALAAIEISGFVYEDWNRNEVRDEGEPLVEDARISIVKMSTKVVLDAEITDEEGAYLFKAVPPGSYPFEITLPSGESFLTEALEVEPGSDGLFVPIPLTRRTEIPRFANTSHLNPVNIPRETIEPISPSSP